MRVGAVGCIGQDGEGEFGAFVRIHLRASDHGEGAKNVRSCLFLRGAVEELGGCGTAEGDQSIKGGAGACSILRRVEEGGLQPLAGGLELPESGERGGAGKGGGVGRLEELVETSGVAGGLELAELRGAVEGGEHRGLLGRGGTVAQGEDEETIEIGSGPDFGNPVGDSGDLSLFGQGRGFQGGEDLVDRDGFVERPHRVEELARIGEGIAAAGRGLPAIGVLAADRPDRKVEEIIDGDSLAGAEGDLYGVGRVELGEDADTPQADLRVRVRDRFFCDGERSFDGRGVVVEGAQGTGADLGIFGVGQGDRGGGIEAVDGLGGPDLAEGEELGIDSLGSARGGDRGEHRIGLAGADFRGGGVAGPAFGGVESGDEIGFGSLGDLRLLDELATVEGDAPDPAVGVVAAGIAEVDLAVLDDGIVPVGDVDRTIGTHLHVDGPEGSVARGDEVGELGRGVGAAVV